MASLGWAEGCKGCTAAIKFFLAKLKGLTRLVEQLGICQSLIGRRQNLRASHSDIRLRAVSCEVWLFVVCVGFGVLCGTCVFVLLLWLFFGLEQSSSCVRVLRE